ncbi:MAG: AAA family ATPase [Candidatus Paceibacterota bacterium]|jgi:hypothetical protein
MKNPFVKADITEDKPQRLKLFMYGNYGTGKTYLALQFPGIALIDPERGSEPYRGVFKFDTLPIDNNSSFQVYEDAIKYLGSCKHQYNTVVLDPLSMLWEVFLYNWSEIFKKRKQEGAGYKFDFYEFQLKDFNTLKAEWKAFIRRLLALDMNIIAIAREKDKFKKGKGDNFLELVGQTFDAEKLTPYYFDTVIQLIQDKGEFAAIIKKNRNNTLGLPTEVPVKLTYETFKNAYPALSKASTPILVSEKMIEKFNVYVKELGLAPDKVEKALQNYGVDNFEDLHKKNGEIILGKLKESVDKKRGVEKKKKEEGEKKVLEVIREEKAEEKVGKKIEEPVGNVESKTEEIVCEEVNKASDKLKEFNKEEK